MKALRIGILGLGTVGQSVARALLERRELLQRSCGAQLVLQRAAVRDLEKPRALPKSALTTRPDELVQADDVDIVVELMGGLEPARSLIEAALAKGKPVITANKRVVSWHGPSLLALAAQRNSELRYEAAVGGGIPLIAPLLDDLAANRILELRAIINGTTNYILTRMAAGETLEAALAEAQRKGYAEADPRDDIEAVDAADKLAILVRHAFGLSVPPREIFRQGLTGLDPKDIAYGREFGYALKLLALARRASNGIEARVHPAFIPSGHPLARIDGAQNAVHVVGDLCGPVMFSGQGAGGDATASAVLADILHVARRLALGDPAPTLRDFGPDPTLSPLADARTRCYFRLAVEDQPGVFAQLTQVLAQQSIGIASVLQREPGRFGNAEVVLLTYEAREAALASAEAQLAKLPCVRAVQARIRVEAADGGALP